MVLKLDHQRLKQAPASAITSVLDDPLADPAAKSVGSAVYGQMALKVIREPVPRARVLNPEFALAHVHADAQFPYSCG